MAQETLDLSQYAPSSAASYGDVTGRFNQPVVARWWNDIFHEGKKQADTKYEQYLNNLNAQNEWKATQAAMAYDKYMSDTQVQRLVKDIKAAGLNPWLAVQNGVSTSGSTSAQKAGYSYKSSKVSKEGSDTGRNLALMLLATAKIIASLA